VAFKIQIKNSKLKNDLGYTVVAQTEPEKGSFFSKMQNQNETMIQNGLARSAGSTSSMGRRLLSRFTDKARKIKSSGFNKKSSKFFSLRSHIFGKHN
jgi:hypothetical protein